MSITPGSTKSKSKTFQEGEEFSELISWVCKNIDTVEWQPEGTNWEGGEPVPVDPRCDLEHKYVITITRYVDKKEQK